MFSRAIRPLAASTAPRTRQALGAACGIAGFALLTALLAQVRVPVPGTPVPMTLQTLAVLLSGMALGPWMGAGSQLLYLAAGAAGFPVFAGGQTGADHLWAATGGYLVAFLPAAALAGSIARTVRGRWFAPMLAAAAGTALIFGGGIAWLWWLSGDLGVALQLGLYPFWVGALLKWALAAGCMGVCRGR